MERIKGFVSPIKFYDVQFTLDTLHDFSQYAYSAHFSTLKSPINAQKSAVQL